MNQHTTGLQPENSAPLPTLENAFQPVSEDRSSAPLISAESPLNTTFTPAQVAPNRQQQLSGDPTITQEQNGKGASSFSSRIQDWWNNVAPQDKLAGSGFLGLAAMEAGFFLTAPGGHLAMLHIALFTMDLLIASYRFFGSSFRNRN